MEMPSKALFFFYLKRRTLITTLLLTASGMCAPVYSQGTYPSRPIKLVVPTTPGSSSDAHARLVADDMSRRLGQAIMVDNRAGAGGLIGADAVAKSPADGYTLLAGSSSIMSMLPAVSKRKLPFDVDKDLVPIGSINSNPFVFVVNPNSQFKDLKELIAAAKQKPGMLSYASAGLGTNPHMLGEMLGQVTGTSLNHVAYRGPGPAQIDVLAGNVDMQFDTPSATFALIKAAKLRPIAVTGTHRFAALPDIPTFAELGYSQLVLSGWTGLYAPSGVPPEVLTKLRDALKETLKSPQIISHIKSSGSEVGGLIGDDLFKEQIRSREVWRKLVADRNITLE